MRDRLGHRLTRLLAITAALAAAVPAAAASAQESELPPAPPGTQDVLVVSNNWEGTADLVDPRTLERLTRLNVIPDRDERIAEFAMDPGRLFIFNGIAELVGEGHNQYVDDGFLSRDGRVVYFSRPSFADVVAISLQSKEIVWRVPLAGVRADHMALSPDGSRLLVSDSTAAVVDVIDTEQGEIVGEIPSGDQPHEVNFSRDGKLIFHASIGPVFTDTDEVSQDATKGKRIFEVIDARTLKVLRTFDMGRELARYGVTVSSAVRPMAIAPDERYVYFQLSFLHGFVEFDLKAKRPLRLVILPLSREARALPRQSYLLDSAHHGLVMNPQGTKLCAAGTMSNYAAIVTRSTLKVERIINVGRVPYWSTTDRVGRYCFVSVAGKDRVSVISWRRAKEVDRIPTGDHPQRMRVGVARTDLLD